MDEYVGREMGWREESLEHLLWLIRFACSTSVRMHELSSG
jgi:hypothetical protein